MTDNDLRTTALHEAGHAVAFYRLFSDGGRYGGSLSIVPANGNLGSHAAVELCFAVEEKLSSEESQAWENEAVYACAGYAAVLAAGYSEDEAMTGCASDFEIAENAIAGELDVIKARAVALMMEPTNLKAVSLLADEVLRRRTLDWEEVEMLIDVADGNATERDYQQYLIMKR